MPVRVQRGRRDAGGGGGDAAAAPRSSAAAQPLLPPQEVQERRGGRRGRRGRQGAGQEIPQVRVFALKHLRPLVSVYVNVGIDKKELHGMVAHTVHVVSESHLIITKGFKIHIS